MKKIIAITLTTLTVLFCFAGCKKKADKVAAVVTNGEGKVVAAVTNEEGNAARDGAGNLYVVVTDADGNVVEENGEMVTDKVIVNSFIEIGDRYEMPDYSIVIPDRWKNSNNKSHQALVLKEDGTENKITIVTGNDSEQKTFYVQMVESIKSKEGATSGSETLKVLGTDAEFIHACAKVSGSTYYVGFITFTHNGKVVSVFITGEEDMSDKIDEIVSIANTIEFI